MYLLHAGVCLVPTETRRGIQFPVTRVVTPVVSHLVHARNQTPVLCKRFTLFCDGSLSVTPAVLEFSMSHLPLPPVGLKGICHYSQPIDNLMIRYLGIVEAGATVTSVLQKKT